ncbi:ATP-binding protein [uncultured Bacteroides sp.]|uniref:hybrid sensor histidine kinase/response regulator transcription factor n=1 Tax=uncultured Bacteroides sp. TaxID=162156 RepID=UPI002AA673C5|nr:ATP-binding protein [uncultured Bacteroides sp.]
MKRIEHEQDNPNSLISDHVNAIIQDSDGDYWYGTNNGVSFYDTKKHEWKHFLNVKGDKYGYSPVVLALCEDYRGNIWVGGYGIGLYSINKRSGEIKKMPKKLKHSGGGISTNYIYSIYAEGDNIWMGGIEGAFTCYNSHTNTYSYYPIDCVGDIKKWNKDSLLIAGCDGLAFFNKSTGKAVWYKNFGDISLHYPIRCLLHASSGDIWLATDGEGLVQFNPINKQARAYTINDGLASNSINSIIEDNVGHIWFNTEKELYCLDPSKGIIINANDFLSISWGYYNPGAALKLRNGNLTFGTAEGAIMFSPSFSLQQNRTVNLIFTNFKLFYQSVKVGAKGSILKANIDQTQKIKLKSEQNSFSISFSAINLVSPYKVRYEYLLEKYQKKWTQTNSVQSVNYMDLPPGKYIFRVKAFDKYTQQKLGERCLEIIISPPFWLSWWAFFIYFVIISAFVFLFVQAKRHQISENRIKDKIRLFIGFAHDIRTPVTLIKAPLSELDGKEDIPEKYKKNISVAVKNVDKLFEMLTQLLNLQKVETHQEGLDITLNDIGEYLRDKISEFRIAARHKGLDIVLQIEPNMFEVWFDKNKMDHIMDNLLSNALKYTEKGFICVAVKKSRKTWSIEVKDTGVGIPKGEQNNIFHEYYRAKNAINSVEEGIGIGLMITRRIVRQHRGKISFSSVENGGTTFVVTLPLKINSNLIAKTENNMELLSTDASQETPVNKNILLLAEDDKDMREYLTSSLASEYQVISVDDGGKALEKAREINPDIIISDIMMPILQGDELCRILKSSVETSHIPIILLTALSERENIILGLESGANDYIIKPFDLSVLKVRLRNILQSRQHLREMVFSLNTTLGEENYTTQLDKEFLDKAMEIMNAELANPDFSINDFCRMIGMSRTSVYNKIKTLTGQGPNDYIRIIRLNKSKELLLSHRFPVAEVSSMVGFSDPKYFSTCFKKQFKISPSKI